MENSEDADRGTMVASGKTYYSISEVCGQMGVEPHVLRYWESEFPQLRPKKNRAGNRAYRDKDIEIINVIKHLLYEEGFTIPGAKRKLAEAHARTAEGERINPALGVPDKNSLQEVKKELEGILALLTGEGAA
jgi:DNA-binding transcriptional MerR regulator